MVISRLLSLLCIRKEEESPINATICDIHLQNLLNNLRSIKAASAKPKNSNITQNASKVYFLLNVLPELNGSRNPNIKEVFSSVVQLCESNILDWSKVNQSFLNRASPSLFKHFCDFKERDVDERDVSEDTSWQRAQKFYTSGGDFSHHDALLKTVRTSSHFLQDLLVSMFNYHLNEIDNSLSLLANSSFV